MKLSQCMLLTDENIHPEVVSHLLNSRIDVRTVAELGLTCQPDDIILAEAKRTDRIVVTHDRDFGRLSVLRRQPLSGIVFLRPGHIDPQHTIATIQAIEDQEFDLTPCFVLVARRRGLHVQIRLRRW